MRSVLLACAGSLVLLAPVTAHHSFAAHYFEEKTVRVEGELVQFDYGNPHAWVRVMVKDDAGALQKVSAEWASATRLQQRGITAETLKPGDRLVITGAPGRDPAERHVHVKTIERPSDGWQWSGRNVTR